MTHNRITGSVDVNMTFTEIAKINALLERDEPKLATDNSGSWLVCPTCGYVYLNKEDKFCRKCGQRIDQDNIAL